MFKILYAKSIIGNKLCISIVFRL